MALRQPPAATIKYASQDQIASLLSQTVVSVRDHAIFTIAYWRGLRASEVGLLQMVDWKPESGRLYIHRVKHGAGGEYLLCADERRALLAWLKVRGLAPGYIFLSRKQTPISRQTLHELIVEYSTAAQWPEDRRHFHVLRHSIATHLNERGLDVLAIKDWLGHRSITSTQVYAQVTNAQRDLMALRAYAQQPGEGGAGSTSSKPPAVVVPVNWKADRKRKR